MKSPILFTLMLLIATASNTVLGNGNRNVGMISGKVIDRQTNEPIPSANIILVGSTRGSATDANGRFVIRDVAPGNYDVKASVVGYTPAVRRLEIAAAQERDETFFLTMENIAIGEVQVIGSAFPKSPDAPVSTQYLSYKELRHSAGAMDDIVRTVSVLPGVAQTRADRNDLIVRGGAPSENLFLVDNFEIPNINHFSNQGSGSGPVSILNMEFVANSAFSTGGFGARYGDKLSSVFNIGLREGLTDRHYRKATLSATQFGVSMEGPAGSSGNYLFSARKSYLDLVFKLYGFGFTPQYWDFLGKATFDLSKHDKLEFLGIGVIDKIKFFHETEDQRRVNSQILFSDQTHYMGGVSWRHVFDAGFTIITARHYSAQYDYLQFNSALVSDFTSSSQETESSVKGEVVLMPSSSMEVSFGVSATAMKINDRIDVMPMQTVFQENITVRSSLDTLTLKAAAFSQVSQQIGELKITSGLRADYFGLLQKSIALSPRLAFTFSPTNELDVSFSIGRYYQAPSSIWLASNAFNLNLSYIGVDQMILGVNKTFSNNIKVSIEGYTKRYFDYPVSLKRTYLSMANTGGGNGGRGEGYASFGVDSLVSAGSGLSQGIELFLQKRLSDLPVYGTMSISYSKSEFSGLDGVARPSSYDQRWIVTVGGGYVPNDQWELSAKFRLYTGQPFTPMTENGWRIREAFNGERIGLNHSLDIRVAKKWAIGSSKLESYLDIQNVYNRKPADLPFFNEQTRNIEDMPTIGIVPTLGVTFSF